MQPVFHSPRRLVSGSRLILAALLGRIPPPLLGPPVRRRSFFVAAALTIATPAGADFTGTAVIMIPEVCAPLARIVGLTGPLTFDQVEAALGELDKHQDHQPAVICRDALRRVLLKHRRRI